MKIFLMVLVLLTSNVYASRARMKALGKKERGTPYISDIRFAFANPSSLNKLNNYVVYESEFNEAGFFKRGRRFNWGVYLGSGLDRQDPSDTTYTGEVDNAYDLPNAVEIGSPVDLFLSGNDMGFSWGVRLHMAADETTVASVKNESTARAIGIGIALDTFTLSINKTLSDERKVGTNKHEADMMLIGGRYLWKGYSILFNRSAMSRKIGSNETEQTELSFGIGRSKDWSSSAKLFVDLLYTKSEAEDKGASTETQERTSMPLTIGFEANANSWLTLRGAITQSVALDEEKQGSDKNTSVSNTDIALGMTLNYGRLMVDGVLESTSDTGELNFGNTISTSVSVVYWF